MGALFATALDGARNPHGLAVLGDRTARDVDPLALEDFDDLGVGNHGFRGLGIGEQLDAMANRDRRMRDEKRVQ
jgi:hypothetical protein